MTAGVGVGTGRCPPPARRAGRGGDGYGELALVALGRVAILRVGVIMLDRFRWDQTLTADTWVAVGLILAAQAYLLVGPSTHAPGAPTA